MAILVQNNTKMVEKKSNIIPPTQLIVDLYEIDIQNISLCELCDQDPCVKPYL
mgnify:CR=1 FL=1